MTYVSSRVIVLRHRVGGFQEFKIESGERLSMFLTTFVIISAGYVNSLMEPCLVL